VSKKELQKAKSLHNIRRIWRIPGFIKNFMILETPRMLSNMGYIQG